MQPQRRVAGVMGRAHLELGLIDKEILEAEFAQEIADPAPLARRQRFADWRLPVAGGPEAAFGQPEAARLRSEMALIGAHAQLDLRAHVVVQPDQREIAMGGRRGQQLQPSATRRGAKRARQVLFDNVAEKGQGVGVVLLPQLRSRGQFLFLAPLARLALGPGQFDQSFQMLAEPALETLVGELLDQYRREADGEVRRDVRLFEPARHLEQRHIGLGRRLEQPMLFHQVVAQPIGKMSMQNNHKATLLFHRQPPSARCAAGPGVEVHVTATDGRKESLRSQSACLVSL